MKIVPTFVAALASITLAACTSQETGQASPQPQAENPAAGTRPAGQPNTVVYEGRVGLGAECRTLTTRSGELWSFHDEDGSTSAGDYVRVTGEIADASYCMEGQGTLIPFSIEPIEAP